MRGDRREEEEKRGDRGGAKGGEIDERRRRRGDRGGAKGGESGKKSYSQLQAAKETIMEEMEVEKKDGEW